jgi:hypothetical protein
LTVSGRLSRHRAWTTSPICFRAGLHSETLAQNTWFQFDDNSSSVQYVVRLLDLPEGDNRGIFTTEITLEEAARLVDMCIEQAMGDSALQARREKNKSYHSW